jgi:hypothetical protein
LAIGLASYLQDGSAYEGRDIIGVMIEWCQENISKNYLNFRFRHADTYNGFTDPHGQQQASASTFPYADESFNLVFLGSLFTHLLPAEVENYLAEIRTRPPRRRASPFGSKVGIAPRPMTAL